MSQPTRYDAADLRCKKCQKNVEVLGVLRSHDEGRFVMWDDYAALQAKNERLDKSNTSLLETIDIIDDKYGELQAENERLRKAGDEMAEHFEGFSEWMENADGSPYVSSRLKAWLAAKGVQP